MTAATEVRVTDDRPYASVGDRSLVSENEADPRASTITLLFNWTESSRR
jgi:hypothetical protein